MVALTEEILNGKFHLLCSAPEWHMTFGRNANSQISKVFDIIPKLKLPATAFLCGKVKHELRVARLDIQVTSSNHELGD